MTLIYRLIIGILNLIVLMKMKKTYNRREFARHAALAGAGSLSFGGISVLGTGTGRSMKSESNENLKISLNAFSFDKPLKAGTMSLDDLLDFCAKTGFSGVDLTGYYFPGYPAVPSDEYIFHIKRKAFRLGIDLGCTGVRNDFTWADPVKEGGREEAG